MSLIAFHRVLISAGILFCLGFAAWEVDAFRGSGDFNALVMAVTFGILGMGLIYYLWRLNRFLGYDEQPGGGVR